MIDLKATHIQKSHSLFENLDKIFIFILPIIFFFPAIFQYAKNSFTLNLTELASDFFLYTPQRPHCSKSLTLTPECYRECVLFIRTEPMTFSSILIMSCTLHGVPSVHNEQMGSNSKALWDKTTFPLRLSTFWGDVVQNRQCWHGFYGDTSRQESVLSQWWCVNLGRFGSQVWTHCQECRFLFKVSRCLVSAELGF